jgi:hypothetical protein
MFSSVLGDEKFTIIFNEWPLSPVAFVRNMFDKDTGQQDVDTRRNLFFTEYRISPILGRSDIVINLTVDTVLFLIRRRAFYFDTISSDIGCRISPTFSVSVPTYTYSTFLTRLA